MAGDIYIMNPDGSGQTRLTYNPGADYDPQWSPDGTKIAFQCSKDGNREIYIMNPDGSSQTRITNDPADDGHPSWSPDGAKMVFDSDRDGNREIYVMNADGSSQTRLTNAAGLDTYPDWSPDGSKIIFSSERDGNREIYVMNADGSNQTRLTNSPGWDYDPVWSPDGSKIAFDSQRNGGYDIYLMNPDGSNQTRLTDNPWWDYDPAWSPDGSKIAFVSLRDGNQQIYVMDVDGSSQTRLTSNSASDYGPAWAPIGACPAPSGNYIVTTGAEVDSTHFASQRKLAVTSDGHLHVAYQREIGGISQIFHSESADGGATWTEEQVTTATRDQDCPALAVDSLNNLHIVWQDGKFFQPGIVPSVLYRAKTTTWGDVEVVAAYAQCPAIAVDSDDHVHVIYGPYVYSPGYYGGGDGKRWRERTTSGWGPEERFSQDQYWGPLQAIAIDGNDNVHVAFRHSPTSTYDTHYRSRNASGWGTETDVGEGGNIGGGGMEPSIAIDSTNGIHIVWAYRDSSTGNYYIKYRQFTTSWQPIVNLEGPTDYLQRTPAISIDREDHIHVVWSGKHSGSPTYYQIRHREFTTSWQPIENLTSSACADQTNANSLWAFWPQIGGQRTNVSQDGHSFIWMDGTTLKYGVLSSTP